MDVLDKCAGCHGATGITYTYYIPNLAGQNAAYTISQLRYFRAAHASGDLRDNPTMEWHAVHTEEKDIERIADFYAAQTCEKGAFNWHGADLKNECTACHGAHGRSTDPSIPNLAGQKVSYMLNQLVAFQNNKEGNPNKNRHIYRTSGSMGQPVDNLPEDALPSLYFFNAQTCR